MDVLEAYLNALANAYDPHSDYMAPEEAQDFNIQAIKHTVTGIGAVLWSDDGYATIEEVIPGGPADLDKRLQAGDRENSVAGLETLVQVSRTSGDDFFNRGIAVIRPEDS